MALKWPKMSIQIGLCMIQDSNILNQDKGKNKKTNIINLKKREQSIAHAKKYKVSKLFAVSPSWLLCLFFRGVWRSLDLLGMKHISSANLQPFKRASALVEAKVIFLKVLL